MKTIWKATIYPNAVGSGSYPMMISAPSGAKFLRVMEQRGEVCVWFECDPQKPIVPMTLYCIGTSYGSVSDDYVYVDSLIRGDYVWHFYQEKQ